MATVSGVITYAGEELAANILGGLSSDFPLYVGWGNGTGTPDKSDTDIYDPAPEDRVLGTASIIGSGATAKLQITATITSLTDQTINCVGFFSQATDGVLFAIAVIDPNDLLEGDQIAFSLQVDPS